MPAQKTFVQEESKNDLWVQDRAKEIIRLAAASFTDEQKKDTLCWNIYHGNFENKKFDYLTKVEGFTYPAKFRNIGAELVRSKLNLLESRQARREFRFKAIAMDERSLKLKVENRVKAYLDSVKGMYQDQEQFLQEQIQSVQDALGDLEAQVQAQPQDPSQLSPEQQQAYQEQQMQLEQLKANMPMIRLEYGKIIRALSRQQLDNTELQKKIDYYLLHTDQEVMQQIANASLKSAIQSEDLYEHWNMGLREKLVTGKPTFITYYDKRREDVTFKQVDAYAAYYDKGGANKWTQNGEWCMLKEHMNMSQIASEFELTSTEANILDAYQMGDYTRISNYIGNTAHFDGGNDLSSTHDKMDVSRIWFLSPREVFYKQSPNKHRDGEFFWNLIDGDTKIKKGEKKHRVVIYDQYACTIIGGVICINHGKQNEVFRSKDIPGLPVLPLVGRSFNFVSDKPYSMIYRLRELIELYDIVNYKKELTIALSGVKGMIMDRSQKPEGMSVDKWIYYRRMGTMWIETMKKGRKVPATFNQFQDYDDGITESIGLFDSVLMGIDALMEKIIGITAPAQGQFVSKDPVANVKMSNEQSALITEMQFSDNDKVFQKALELYLNLKIQYVWEKGKVINFLNPSLEEVLVQIPKNFLSGADFRLYTSNNIKEDSQLEDIRQVAVQAWGRTELPINALISLFKIEDLNELENTFIQFAKEAEQIKQQNAMAVDNNKAQQEQQTLQMEGNIKRQIESTKNQLLEAKIQIERAQFDLDTQKFQWESQYKERELQAKTQIDSMKIAAQNEIESGYLQEEGRANRTNEILKSFELKINSIMNEIGMKNDQRLNTAKVSLEREKIMKNKANLR